MDILKMLNEDRDLLIKEDLEFFEVELATGDYDRDYIKKCLILIKEIRQFKNIKATKTTKFDNDNPYGDAYIEIPISENDFSFRSKKERIKKYVLSIRNMVGYVSDFIAFVESQKIDEQIIDELFTFFTAHEKDLLLEKIAFSEKFLEKYFQVLNHRLVAEYQLFSENFFMKHFDKLDYEIVLKKGKNPWVDKSNRSSKLTIFLKLKGITL